MNSEIVDLGSYPKAKLESIRSVLCATCLSFNRVLHPVAALRHLVPLLNDVGLDITGSICWECRAIMDNFDKFKNRATKSNSTLNSLVGKNNIPMVHIYKHVRSLSTLGQSTKQSFDAQFNFHITEENLRFGDNEQSDFIDSLHMWVDVEICQEKAEKEEEVDKEREVDKEEEEHKVKAEEEEEVYIKQETERVENSNMQLLTDRLVPSAESNLTVPGSFLTRLLMIPSQLPKALVKNSNSESGSKYDNLEQNIEGTKNNTKPNKRNKQLSHSHLITKILTEDEMLKYREEQRAETWFKNAKFGTCVDVEYLQEKAEKEEEDKEEAEEEEEVYLSTSIQHETVPVENSNVQLLIDRQVPSAESNLTVPGSCRLATPSQLPRTLILNNNNSESGSKSDDNYEENFDEDNEEMTNESKKQLRAFSHMTDMITKILTEDELLKYREKQGEQTRFKNAKFHCITCIVHFASKEALTKHNRLHCLIKQGKFTCSICDLKFSSQKAVNNHKQTHYRYYDCRYCSYSSYSQKNLMRHWQRAHDLRPNRQCIDCVAEFPSYRQLLSHMSTVHGEKLSCMECGKTFIHSSNLNKHILLHTGSVPEVECAICHKKIR